MADFFSFGPNQCFVFQERICHSEGKIREWIENKILWMPSATWNKKQVNASKHGLLGVGMETDAFSFAAHLHRWYIWRVNVYETERVPTVPPVRANGVSASAGGLGGTLTFAPFMMREQDLGYDPAHPRPPIALIQIGLWGILQHLKHKTARMKTVGMGLD